MEKNLEVKRVNIESKLLFMWLSLDIVLALLRYILNKFNISEGVFRETLLFAISSIPLIYFLLNLSKFKVRKWLFFAYLYILVLASVLTSIIINPELYHFFTRSYYGISRMIFPNCAIFAFLFFYIQDNPKYTLNVVIKYSYIYFAYQVIVNLIPALLRGFWIDIGPNGEDLIFRYNLSFGYAIAFPTMIFLFKFIRDKKIYDLVLFILGLFCVLTQGNRGSLLIIIIYIFLYYLKIFRNSNKKLFKISLLILVLLLVYFYMESILNFLLNLFNDYGYQSRNIEKIINGSFTSSNGRDFIWGEVLNTIKKIWPMGLGTFGDRPIVAPIHIAGYSHNIFLELLVSYGIIGMLLILIIFSKLIYMIFFCNDDDWYYLYIIMLSCSAQLLLSQSFWYIWQFWATVAISLNYIKKKKSTK